MLAQVLYSFFEFHKLGLSPFVPIKTKFNPVKIVIGSVLSIIKMSLVFINLTIVCLLLHIASFLPFSRFITFLPSFFLVRLSLFISGFFVIESKYVSLKKGRSKTINNSMPGLKINHGDIIVINHSSYIDLLYLQYR